MNIAPENISQELKALPHWVCWRYVDKGGPKPTKPPFQVDGELASVDDPTTWTGFDNALAAYKCGGLDGVGFVLITELGIVGFDLDNCVSDGGEVDAGAASIVERLDTYCEISPSGHGLRLLTYGTLPLQGRHAGYFECYAEGRYLTFTGNVLGDLKRIAERQEAINQIHRERFPKIYSPKIAPLASKPTNLERTELLAKAMAAKNGYTFRRLWDGDISGYSGDESAADMALMGHRRFWTGGDPGQMERLFTTSALGQRSKWRDRQDYRERTIAAALTELGETYSPNDLIADIQVLGPDMMDQDNEEEHRTDLGLAKRIVALHGADMRYVCPWKVWLVWTGRLWATDDTGQAESWAKEGVASIYCDAQVAFSQATEAAANGDKAAAQAAKQRGDEFFKWGQHSEATARIDAALKSARSESGVAVRPEDLDSDPFVLNCLNGTVDLKTGLLGPHKRRDLLTKLAPVNFNPDAAFPLWSSFLDEAIPDVETRSYVQRCVGATIVGRADNDLLLVCHGVGGTGKSTFINSVSNQQKWDSVEAERSGV